MGRIKIINGRVLTPYRTFEKGTVLVDSGLIAGVEEGDAEAFDAPVLDARGRYVAPGFIDLHVHGGGGHDFMDGTTEAFRAIAALHARHGTTAMTPTTLSCEKEDLERSLEAYEATAGDTGGAAFIGMHLEGPYFAQSQRGAQDPRYIRNPEPEEYRGLVERFPSIQRWSAAPELPGALELGRYLRKHGILVALAHTDAIYEEVLAAFEAGYTHATHLYSAMSGVTRRGTARYAGAIESAFLLDGMTVEIIADGVHLPAPLLKLVYKIKGAAGTALITDAMRAAGMPPGESILGHRQHGLRVLIEDGVARLPDRTAFAGSVATADRLVRNMVQMAEVPMAEAVCMMSATPAAIMGVGDRKGSLVRGKDADIVIFDEQVRVACTLIAGRIAYESPDFR